MDARRRERLSSLFWLICSALFCIASLKYSLGTFHQPGPGFFPFLGGAILCFLSLLNLLRTTMKTEDLIGKVDSLILPKNCRNIILTLVVLFAYPLLLGLIGFLPTTFLFFVALLRFVEPKGWGVVLGGAGVGAISSYLIFQYWLKIEFPIGIFGM